MGLCRRRRDRLDRHGDRHDLPEDVRGLIAMWTMNADGVDAIALTGALLVLTALGVG